MGELRIIDGSERNVKLYRLLFTKKLFLLFVVHNQAFLGRRRGLPVRDAGYEPAGAAVLQVKGT